MESIGYDQFSSSDTDITRHSPIHQALYPARQNRRMYIMFGILTLFLLLLTLTVGIKFSKMDAQVSDVKDSLNTIRTSVNTVQKASIFSPEPVVKVKGSCENDWFFYKEKCYFVSKYPKNWNDAEKDCIQRRAHLLVVNNRDELNYISQVIESQQLFWIGLVERVDGNWTWVDGTNIESTEQFWDEGQPDNWSARVNGEDCGQLHPIRTQTQTLRLWNDADCTVKYRYICEGRPRIHL